MNMNLDRARLPKPAGARAGTQSAQGSTAGTGTHHVHYGLYLDASSSLTLDPASPASASLHPSTRRRSRPCESASTASTSSTATATSSQPQRLPRHQFQQQDRLLLSATDILLARGGDGKSGTAAGGGNKNYARPYHYNDYDTTLPAFDTTTPTTTPPSTALTLARQAPLAGYLNKLGQTVRQFKRRFFVLQPTTTLYYFLSPDDVEPRGCLDLEGATIVPKFHPNKPIYQFAIQLPRTCSTTKHTGDEPMVEVLLEARSEAEARQWIQTLQNERFDVYAEKYKRSQLQISAYKSRIMELEKILDQFKLVEADRDGALEDAAQWKLQFEQLDEGLRRYAQQILDQNGVVQRTATADHDENNENHDTKFIEDSDGNHCLTKDETVTRKLAKKHDIGETDHETNGKMENRNSSTAGTSEDNAVPKRLDPIDVPGKHFSSFWKTIEQMKQNLQVASHEAAAAIEDVKQAHRTVHTLEKRMAQAETHLCKIWEENCELRKTLNKYKREKRLLIAEVKNLREQQQHQQKEEEDGNSQDDDVNDNEQQKLLADIEVHVQASIQLQRELVTGGSPLTTTSKISTSKRAITEAPLDTPRESEKSLLHGIIGSTLRLSCGPTPVDAAPCQTTLDTPCNNNTKGSSTVTKMPIMASLLDDDDDDGIDSDSSSTCLQLPASQAPQHEIEACTTNDDNYSQRSNPIDKLDVIDLDDDETPSVIAVSSSSTSHSRPMAPTSQLLCPLADVVTSNACSNNAHSTLDGEVYHLTFYSSKIGLQFQKVPPPPVKATGLLTEAMTADMTSVSLAGDKTAAELRRIANISGTAKSERDNALLSCQVARPIDAVLVCGFVGFDDYSSDNKRPKLGARLVAFDGVSLEAGAWTFQSVRKAIQARRRPLTLSFRNDFLTTEQRKILTKAVKDMENLSPSAGIGKAIAHLTEPVSRQSSVSQRTPQIDEMSSSSSNSIGLGDNQSGSSTASFSKFRSFSEAGSSVSVLSAVGPLVSNLLGQRRDPFTPEYLRRPPVSIEESPHHLDFKSVLL